MRREFEIYIDGACSGNPGEASIGVVIKEGGKTVKEISKTIGPATNNIAEYSALIYGLQEALIEKAAGVNIVTDSELLFHQVKGKYKVKNENLKILWDQVQHLAKGFEHIDIKHVPREQNKEADHLASQALKSKQAKVVAPLFNNEGEESPSSEG